MNKEELYDFLGLIEETRTQRRIAHAIACIIVEIAYYLTDDKYRRHRELIAKAIAILAEEVEDIRSEMVG